MFLVRGKLYNIYQYYFLIFSFFQKWVTVYQKHFHKKPLLLQHQRGLHSYPQCLKCDNVYSKIKDIKAQFLTQSDHLHVIYLHPKEISDSFFFLNSVCTILWTYSHTEVGFSGPSYEILFHLRLLTYFSSQKIQLIGTISSDLASYILLSLIA